MKVEGLVSKERCKGTKVINNGGFEIAWRFQKYGEGMGMWRP
jgi:hypothetical protein